MKTPFSVWATIAALIVFAGCNVKQTGQRWSEQELFTQAALSYEASMQSCPLSEAQRTRIHQRIQSGAYMSELHVQQKWEMERHIEQLAERMITQEGADE